MGGMRWMDGWDGWDGWGRRCESWNHGWKWWSWALGTGALGHWTLDTVTWTLDAGLQPLLYTCLCHGQTPVLDTKLLDSPGATHPVP